MLGSEANQPLASREHDMIKFKSTAQFFGVTAVINVVMILLNPDYAVFHLAVAIIATGLALYLRHNPPKWDKTQESNS
jgi:hypothetical protein